MEANSNVNAGESYCQAVADFLADWKCYDLIPPSNKVLVFDVDIPIRLAFYALVEHGVFAAPLWDSAVSSFAGMLTTSDFIHLIRHFHARGIATAALATHTVRSWHEMAIQAANSSVNDITAQHNHDYQSLASFGHAVANKVAISAEASLLTACQQLRQHKIHRLPIIDPKGELILGVLTHKAILQHIVNCFVCDQRNNFTATVETLQVGSFVNIETVSQATPLIEVLNCLALSNISAVPVIDEEGIVVDIYTREDVMFLATDVKLVTLDQSVSDAKKTQRTLTSGRTELVTCKRSNSLQEVIELFGSTGVQRMVCVDDVGKCDGIIALADIFEFCLAAIDQT